MSSLAHLGPPIPTEQPDTEPLRIHAVKLLGLGPMSDALVRFTVSQNTHTRAWTRAQQAQLGGPVEPIQVVMTIAVNPRNLEVLRATEGTRGGSILIHPLHTIPGTMIDLAQSLVRDHYSVRAKP